MADEFFGTSGLKNIGQGRGLSVEEPRDLPRKLQMTGEQVRSRFIDYRDIVEEEYVGEVGEEPVVEAIVPLETAAVISSGTLAVTAETTATLQQADAASSATLALTAPAKPVLQQADAASTGMLTLRAPAIIAIATAGQSAGTLTLTAAAIIALTAAGQSSATLDLTTPTVLGIPARLMATRVAA